MLSEKRFKQYERLLRRVRICPALYGDRGEQREVQAERVRDKIIMRCAPHWDESARRRRNAQFMQRYDIDTAIYYSRTS